MRTRRWVAAAAAAMVLTGASGCGGGGDDPAAEGNPTVESASSEPVESESAEQEAAGGYDAQELMAAMKAAVAEEGSAHIEMQGGGQGMNGVGDVSYAGDSTAMQMRMELPTGTALVRMVDGVMYVAMPPMTPKGKFLKLDTNDPNTPFGDLPGITQGDPRASFDAFDAGLEKATYVGREDVDGEQLDHYVLTVDTAKAARAQGLTLPGGKTSTYDLWIDDQDLLRRMQVGSGAAGMTVTLSDWGKPVTVKAPPASAVMELPGSMG